LSFGGEESFLLKLFAVDAFFGAKVEFLF
jgi:hypothetical protein